ncbi:MAG: M81 family metallopeptidase, partial [Candidatus Bathyarchaeia archaeon]
MRIIVGGISHETNTFNTSPTRLEAFRILRGKELYRDEAIKSLLRSGIHVIPTMYASALPSGLVEKDAYIHLREDLLGRIEAAGRFDGICLFLHGAMEVEGIGDGESDLVKTVRETLGEDVLISVSLDLHGNISPELLDSADMLTAYRTAPHVDSVETKVRAALLLVNCIKKKTKPISVIVKPPVLLSGEMVVTNVEPASGLYRKLREIDQSSCVLNSSLLVGMAWADTPNAGASVIIVAEREDCWDEAYEKACELAMDYWEKRSEFHLEVASGSVDETIRMAEAYPKKPVFISDSGDNITAGAAGDIPLFVDRLISLDVTDAVVGAIVDPGAVSLCKKAGVGNSL